MWGGVGGGGSPPTNMFGFKSPSGDLKPNRNTTKNPVLWNPVLWNPVWIGGGFGSVVIVIAAYVVWFRFICLLCLGAGALLNSWGFVA